MIKQSREEAINRMINQAIDLDADAIIGVRFMTSMVMQGASEMLVLTELRSIEMNVHLL